jgi:hypothetical protein
MHVVSVVCVMIRLVGRETASPSGVGSASLSGEPSISLTVLPSQRNWHGIGVLQPSCGKAQQIYPERHGTHVQKEGQPH